MARWWSRLVIVVLLVGCGKLAPKSRMKPTNAPGTGGSEPGMGANAGEGQSGSDSIEATGGTGGRSGGTQGAGTGGRSEGGGSNAGSSNGGVTVTAGMAGGGLGGRVGSAGGRGGEPASPYEPTNMDVPANTGGAFVGGSFEGHNGDGWDTCGSHFPGPDPSPSGTASDGTRYLLFDSTFTCDSCAQNEGDLQMELWFDAPIPAGTPLYLYFDVADFGPKRPTGTLFFGSVSTPTSNPCLSNETLASIPLEELAMTGEWQTRCVAITPKSDFSIFGLYVADGTFKIGLDALRFGPPCR